MKTLSIEILKERLRRSTWLPLTLMLVIFLAAMATTLHQQRSRELSQMRSALGELIRSQQTQITQEVLLGQDQGVKMRVGSVLSDWKHRYPNVQACFSFTMWPVIGEVKKLVICSRESDREVSQELGSEEQVLYINAGNRKLGELRYGVIRHPTILDNFPPAVIIALLLGLVVALFTHFILVKRIEKNVLSPLLVKLAEDERMAAIAQTAQMLAHDVRKPFSLVQLALLRLQTSENEEVRRFGKSVSPEIARSLRSIDSMFRDILDVNRQMEPVLERFPVSVLVDRIQDNIKKLRPDSEIKISYRVEDNLTLFADPEQLERVLMNLVENAFAAMGEQGNLHLEAKKVSKTDGESNQVVQFKLNNSGPIIPKETQEKLFAPHFTGRRNGTGLGLFIARKIVNGHGGEIHCVSTAKEGTSFIFHIPTTASVTTVSRDTVITIPKTIESKTKNILVFDDERLVREHWKERLSSCTEHQIADFRSWEDFIAKDGFEIANENTIAFVDIHYSRSKHSGVEIARSLRQIGVRRIYAITSDEYTAEESQLFNEVFGKTAPDNLKRFIG